MSGNEPVVGVLARVVAILDAVEIRPAGAAELGRQLGLSMSTVYRLTAEMAEYGLLRKDSEGRFHVGIRFMTASVAELSMPVLRRLAADTGESAQLWVRRGDQRLCVASIDTPHELRVAMPVGTMLPLPSGSSGHVLSGDWQSDPASVRRGWWESVSERTPGLASVSVPVRTNGAVVASVCVAAPIGRIGESPGSVLGARIIAAAKEIERALSFT
ncbi:MAG TPA: helix-turn-helix domain-containing protein [Aldersonia sp.]